MEFEFRNGDLERLFLEGGPDCGFPPGVVKAFILRIQTIDAAPDERTFRELKSLHYEKLKGDRAHQRSMRLNKQYRLILELEESDDGKKVIVIAIEDYH